MKDIETTVPKLMFAIGTRAALAFGMGLLVSPRLSDERRETLGRTLIVIGALTTIPALLGIFGGRREQDEHEDVHDHEDGAPDFDGRPVRDPLRMPEVPVF